MKNASYEELLIDIENTQNECLAYDKLSDGFYILSQLPENKESGKSSEYWQRSYYYSGLGVDCRKFLMRLLSIKEDRNI